MAKVVTVGSISDFLNAPSKKEQSTLDKIVAHYEDYSTFYNATGLTVVIVLTGDVAYASSGIDAKATELYWKLVSIGKWVIIVKGGIDVIKAVANGDYDSAKKGFLGNILVFGLLLAYPWAMGEIEQLGK